MYQYTQNIVLDKLGVCLVNTDYCKHSLESQLSVKHRLGKTKHDLWVGCHGNSELFLKVKTGELKYLTLFWLLL